jgi:hypothetical protein
MSSKNTTLEQNANIINTHNGVLRMSYTSPSSVSATLVKMVFLAIVSIALRLESRLVPGATPKNPFSGLIARRDPSFLFGCKEKNT